MKHVLTCLIAFALLAAPARADLHEDFDAGALNMEQWALYPSQCWTLTQAGVMKATTDDQSKYTHLSTKELWSLRELTVRTRVEHRDAPGSRLDITVAPESGRQLVVMLERTVIKIMRNGGDAPPQVVATHPMTYEGDWQTLRIVINDEQTEVLFNDVSFATLPTGDLAGPSRMRALAYQANAAIDAIHLTGREHVQPLPRIGQPIDAVNYNDPTRQRHYSEGVVEIQSTSDAEAAKLPAVKRWRIGTPDYSSDEFTDQTKFAGVQTFQYNVGQSSDADMPTRLREFIRKNTPEAGEIRFNLAEGGVYTLMIYLAGAKNLGNQLSVSLDGQLLYRDLMRGSNPKAIDGWFREHIPVKLDAGPHVLEVRGDFIQARFASHMMSLYFDSLALEPGVVPLVFDIDASQRRPIGERSASITGSRTLGRDFAYHINNLPAGELDVELMFYEAVTDHKGFRAFNVTANGETLLTDFDIVAAIGSGKLGSRTFKITAPDGALDLHFAATVGRAQINAIRITQNGQKIVTVNCGASPDRSYGMMAPSDVREAERGDLYDNRAFRGAVNVVADPDLETGGDEPYWRPIADAMPDLTRSPVGGEGEMQIDDAVAHGGSHALRLGPTRGDWGVRGNLIYLDWTRPVRLTAYAKAENATGSNRIALQWLIPDGKSAHGYDAHGSGVSRVGLTLGPVSEGESLAGTFDWKQISLDAQPPRGAAAAIIMIRSDNNDGRIWFDDFHMDGYGNLPVEIIAALGGYQRGGDSTAVVLAQKPLNDLTFTLHAGDAAVFEGKLQTLADCDWLERHAYLADFGAHKQEGTFTLRAGGATSLPFAVRNAAYLDLARHMAFYFFAARCGQEVPGYHQACHMDDALVQSPYYDRASRVEPGRDLVGGWHDAGDYGKFNKRTWGPLYSLARLALDASPKWNQYGDDVPDIVSEVIWGADYTLKIHEGNGLFVAKVNGGFRGGHPAMPPSLETDGDPATVDGFGRTAAWLADATAEPAFALAAAARAVKPYDADRAARYLDAAQTCYENTTDFWQTNRGDHAPDWRDLYFDPKAMLAAIEIHRAGGDADPDPWLDHILPLVDDLQFVKAPYAWSFRWQKGSYNSFQFDFLIAPLELLRDDPNHPRAAEIKRIVRKAIDQVVVPALQPSRTPFGQMTNLVIEDQWYYRSNYMTELYPQTAYALALAANVLDEPAWRPYAERNLQWMTGRNVYNASYVSAIADRQATPWTGLIHVAGFEHGSIPGAIAKGLQLGDGNVAWQQRHVYPGRGMPAGFFWVFLDTGDGYQPHNPATEIWEWFNHPTLMAALELHRAIAPDETGDDLPPMPLGSTNLIDNAGFERATDLTWVNKERSKWTIEGDAFPDNWDPNGDQAGVLELIDDPAQARHGNRVLRVNKPDDYRSAMLINRRPYFEVAEGEVYSMTVWMRGKGRIKLWAHEYEQTTYPEYRYSRELGDVELHEQWNRFDVPYRVTGKDAHGKPITHVRYGFGLMPGTDVYVDDFEVRRMARPNVPRPQRLK